MEKRRIQSTLTNIEGMGSYLLCGCSLGTAGFTVSYFVWRRFLRVVVSAASNCSRIVAAGMF
jgi:hypothetical protein